MMITRKHTWPCDYFYLITCTFSSSFLTSSGLSRVRQVMKECSYRIFSFIGYSEYVSSLNWVVDEGGCPTTEICRCLFMHITGYLRMCIAHMRTPKLRWKPAKHFCLEINPVPDSCTSPRMNSRHFHFDPAVLRLMNFKFVRGRWTTLKRRKYRMTWIELRRRGRDASWSKVYFLSGPRSISFSGDEECVRGVTSV